jgi:23S rRNA pseudouridine1911/1915/1917 synthase
MNQIWTISEGHHGARLDVFLTEQLPDTSRSQIAKALKRGGATVNGKVASVHQFLKTNDEVAFSDTGKPEEPTYVAPILPAPPLEIIDETPDWIVVNKASGVLVHPDAKQHTGTLADSLVAHDPAIAKIGEDPERPGIMHRLDKEASGLMVIAKTQDAFDDLKKQFAEHTVDKSYVALVYGEMDQEEGDIKFRIAHSKTKNRMAARPQHEEEGRAAWTHYKVREQYRNAALLDVSIFSGRTHQIRAHLLALNHPIIGDPLYKRPKEDRSIKAPRLMLQSYHLAFRDPKTQEIRSFDIPLDKTFDAVSSELRS